MKRKKKHQYAVLSWENAVEKVYEYIISKMEVFFGIKNTDYLSVYIQELDAQPGLYIGLYNNFKASFKFPLGEDEIEKLPWTGMVYEKYIMAKNSNNIYFNGCPVLNEEEVRYLKLDHDSIKDILAKTVYELYKQIFKCKKIYMSVTCNNKNSFDFIISEEYCDIDPFSFPEAEDITALLIDRFS